MQKLLICCLMLLSVAPVIAQKLVKAGELTSFQETYEDTVQFLPGAVVVVHHDINDNGRNNVYQYRSGKFVRVTTKLPPDLRGWTSFNWQSVDYRDQIDRSDFEEPNMASFVPSGAKTKAFAVLPGRKKSLVFICYSLIPGHEWDSGNERDLYLLMLSRGPFTRDTAYTKLADVRVVEASYFGGLFVQKQPQGTFVLLYSNSGSGHITNSVTVFKIQ